MVFRNITNAPQPGRISASPVLALNLAFIRYVLCTIGILITSAGFAQQGDNAEVGDEARRNDSRSVLSIFDAQAVLIENVTLAAPVAGIVDRLPLDFGDRVQRGDLVLQIRATSLRAELAAARAAATAAQMQAETDVTARGAMRMLDVRKREYELSRLANQAFEGSVTSTELDRLKLVVDQAALSLEKADHEQRVAIAIAKEKIETVNRLEAKLAEHQLECPITGKVADRLVDVGQWVAAGTPVVRVISLDPIRVTGFVDGLTVDGSLLGRPVTFTWQPPDGSSLDGQTLSGVISFVSDELNPISGEISVWADVPNPGGNIRPGMQGVMTIELSKPIHQANPKP